MPIEFKNYNHSTNTYTVALHGKDYCFPSVMAAKIFNDKAIERESREQCRKAIQRPVQPKFICVSL